MIKKLGSVLLGLTLLFTLVACADTEEAAAAEDFVYVSVDINPSIEFIVDENDIVVSYSYNNEDAKMLCIDEDFIGWNIEDAIEQFIILATEAGFIDVEAIDNVVLFSVLGGEKNDGLVTMLRARIRARVGLFLAMNHITGEVISDDYTLEDLLAQAEDLGITPAKLKLILYAQTIDEELTLEDAVDMAVKDLLAIIKEAHEGQELLTEAQKNAYRVLKEARMEQFRHKLQEHLEDQPELTPEQVDAIVTRINAAIMTRTESHLMLHTDLTEDEIAEIMAQVRSRITNQMRTEWEDNLDALRKELAERVQNYTDEE